MVANKKNPVILNESEIDSTLLDLDTLALAIPQSQEIEEKVQLITEIESIAELAKQELSVKRQQVELMVENKKLDTANKTIDSIDKIISAVGSKEVLERVIKKIKTPMDMKMMAEAAERMANTLKMLMNPNTLDAIGTKKHKKINFMFKSNGPVQAAIQIDNSDD